MLANPSSNLACIMNTIKPVLISLIAATTAFAEIPEFEVEARYEGFDPSLFAEVHTGAKKPLPHKVLAAPRVTTKAGQTGVIEISREVVLPVTLDGKAPESPTGSITFALTDAHGNTTVDGRKTANCGVSLEVSPEFKNGQIVLSGKSTVRHLQQPGPKQPLNAVSFTTRETYFSDVVTDGQTITIRVGDGPKDKAQITLKITLIAPDGTPIKKA